jgi:4'-phosphopantetheinyl transferase
MKPDWKQTDPNLTLSPDCIDLWKIDLNREDRNIFMHAQYLSSDEHARAGKYINGKKSREFIITRSVLRNVLGHVLKENPKYLVFDYTREGMPVLSTCSTHSDICFNVSHSYDLALIALSIGHPVGIDIEKVREDIDLEALSKRFFSENEYHNIMQFEGQERLCAFFATWTRKEAIVKAMGTGIASGLKSFDVSVDPTAPAKLQETRWTDEVSLHWTLKTIDTDEDYFACLASSGEGKTLRYWTVSTV